MTETPEPEQYTAAQIMYAIRRALAAHDMPAVAGLMPMLAVRDPDSASLILAALDAARLA